MQAIVASGPGGPEVLELAEVPDPVPGEGDVLIDVVAAGVNRADLMQRAGRYPPPPGASELLGLEVSGVVVSSPSPRFQPGDEVCALLAGGGYATRVAVPAGQVMPVPAGVDLVDAAALPEVAATVWSTVFMAAALRPGEVLLVHGGSSGIGTMAVQLGRHIGARVAVTARTAAKLAACRELGAEILVDYSSSDFVHEVRAATGGHGADVVLDVVGGPYLARNVDVLAPDGRLVLVGLQGGRTAEVDLGALTAKRLSVLGATLRARPAEQKAAICASVVEHVWPLVSEGRVRPVVHDRLPLRQAGRAHELLADSDHIGKVLLVTGRAEGAKMGS